MKLRSPGGPASKTHRRLFNSSWRQHTKAIDIHEGQKLDAGAFKALVKAEVAENALATRTG